MGENNKTVVFILFKYSIVVKGIERRLTEAGFVTEEIIENFQRIMNFSSSADLFVFYLPEDIIEDRAKNKELKSIFEQLKACGKKVIVMGELEHHDFLQRNYPDFSDYKWIERPMDSEKLCNLITEMIAGNASLSDRKKILIVDDDPSYAGMVRLWLKDKFQMSVVTGGMQAITYLLKNTVDLILLDYEMPVVDGPQVLQMLRQEPATANIPVVFLTGVSSKDGVSKVMELKPNGYILKSTSKEDLVAYINKTLS